MCFLLCLLSMLTSSKFYLLPTIGFAMFYTCAGYRRETIRTIIASPVQWYILFGIITVNTCAGYRRETISTCGNILASPVGCPKYSKHWIFDLIWTFPILRIQDLNIFELWISVFTSIRFELRIFQISRIYSTPWLGLIFEWNWAELAVLISW